MNVIRYFGCGRNGEKKGKNEHTRTNYITEENPSSIPDESKFNKKYRKTL